MFLTVFSNVLLMLVYMAIGFVIIKTKKGDATHAKTLSAILLYVLTPCMIIGSFVSMEYSKDNLIKIVEFFFACLIVLVAFFFIIYVIVRKKIDNPKYRVMSIASVFGNVAFFGIPVITSIYPTEPIVVCYCTCYAVSMNVIAFTIGVFMITNDKQYVSVKKAILNPATLSLLVSIPLFLLNIKFPEVISTPMTLLGKMVTPVCMFILGMRLATVKLQSLFTRPFVYLTVALKMIVFPFFALLCVKFIPGLDEPFKNTLFVLSAAPSASILSALAELHDCEQELCANVVLLTTILSVIILPVLVIIVI